MGRIVEILDLNLLVKQSFNFVCYRSAENSVKPARLSMLQRLLIPIYAARLGVKELYSTRQW